MMYTKWILAAIFILALVIVYKVSKDTFSEVDGPMILSSHFGRRQLKNRNPDKNNNNNNTSNNTSKDKMYRDSAKGTKINTGKGKTVDDLATIYIGKMKYDNTWESTKQENGTCPGGYFKSHEAGGLSFCTKCPNDTSSSLAYHLQPDCKYSQSGDNTIKSVDSKAAKPYKAGKSAERKQCDKYATENQKMFKPCKGVKGKKRYKCIGKYMPDCMIDQIDRRNKEDKKKKDDNEISAIVYEHNDFGGSNPLKLTGFAKYPALSKISWNNKISSAKVMPGYKLQLYDHSKYRGGTANLQATGSKGAHFSSMPNFNDKASSLVVTRA